jgi:hypothetical protein
MGLHIEYTGLVISAFAIIDSDGMSFNVIATFMIELGTQHAIHSLRFLDWFSRVHRCVRRTSNFGMYLL